MHFCFPLNRMMRRFEMAKYAVHTKWEWPNGVPSADTMQGWHREFKSQTKAEDIIWFQNMNLQKNKLIFHPGVCPCMKELFAQ